MKQNTYLGLVFLALLIGLTAYIFLQETRENRGPRYTLESFKRQWNVHSPNPKAHLSALYKVEGGYSADYGEGVSLFVAMPKGTVTGAHISYEPGTDQGSGGPRFLLLMHTAINVGTFRWPQERIDHVRQIFSLMSPQPQSYRFLYTSFTRMYEQSGKWEFIIDYVANKAEENSEAPSPP